MQPKIAIRANTLIEMTRETKKKQFEEIYVGHYTRLYYFALNLIGDKESSRDLLNDVFTSLWNQFDNIDLSSISWYLTTSVRNRAVDFLRHNIQKSNYSKEYVHEAAFYYDDYTDDRKQLVDEMINKLSPPTDTILEMCYLRQMKYSEVAEKLNISTSTVKKHIIKALKTLRDFYGSKCARNEIRDVLNKE